MFDDVFENLTLIYAIISIFSKNTFKHINIDNYEILFLNKP